MPIFLAGSIIYIHATNSIPERFGLSVLYKSLNIWLGPGHLKTHVLLKIPLSSGQDTLDDFLQFLNGINTNIQFTMEVKGLEVLLFLDLLVLKAGWISENQLVCIYI